MHRHRVAKASKRAGLSQLLVEGIAVVVAEVPRGRGYGMVAAADHATNLEKLMEEGGLKSGSVIAMTTVAGGGHCPTLLIRWL